MSVITYGDEATLMESSIETAPHGSAAAAREFPLDEAFDVARTADHVVRVASERADQSGIFRIALQFPDELLADATAVVSALRAAITARKSAELTFDLFVLGDTSYGSCCVDELAASHGSAAMVVHYGRSCLSRTQRLPVLLVFGKRRVDADALLDALQTHYPADGDRRVVVFVDCVYDHAFDDALRLRIATQLPHVIISRIASEEDSAAAAAASVSESLRTVCGRQFEWPSAELDAVEDASAALTWRARLPPSFVPLWLGAADSPTAKALQVSLQRHALQVLEWRAPVFSSVPLKFQLNRFLMRRHTMVERCRSAKAIALLCGTLAAARYADLLVYLRQLARRETKCYTLVVGKPNEAKLANLGAIEAYCLVACRESTLLACETREFGAPIVTPLEVQIAYERSAACEWNNDYTTDFDEVLRRRVAAAAAPARNSDDDDNDRAHFSLTTGRIVQRQAANGIAAPSADADQLQLTNSNGGGALVEAFASSVAMQHLQQSTFRGLDPRLGLDEPSAIVEGRQGIASGYANEKEEEK
jgi:diphthamide biosynthesis protein 2